MKSRVTNLPSTYKATVLTAASNLKLPAISNSLYKVQLQRHDMQKEVSKRDTLLRKNLLTSTLLVLQLVTNVGL